MILRHPLIYVSKYQYLYIFTQNIAFLWKSDSLYCSMVGGLGTLLEALPILAGRTVHPLGKSGGETAGVSEAHELGGLFNGIMVVLKQQNALTDAVILQIFGYGLSGHLLEETAAALSGNRYSGGQSGQGQWF